MKQNMDYDLRRVILILVFLLIFVFVVVFQAINVIDKKPVTPLAGVLAQNNLSLECSSWSQKDVLAYNLTCTVGSGKYFYNKISLDKSCLTCKDKSCYDGDLANFTSTIIQNDDKCLEYKIVPIQNVNPTFIVS